eukprot:11479888-Ditylum_brightwellii.AAC.1
MVPILEWLPNNIANSGQGCKWGISWCIHTGFAMLCAGSVHIKNVHNTMLKNLLDACSASLGFYIIGYTLVYSRDNFDRVTIFIGTSIFFLMDVENYTFWLLQFAFAATAATIVA